MGVMGDLVRVREGIGVEDGREGMEVTEEENGEDFWVLVWMFNNEKV